MLTLYFNRMGTKNKYLWIVPIVVIGFIFTGCPKECVSPVRSYQAEYMVVHNDTIQVGDTIWIYSEMDCGEMYNFFTSTYDSFCGHNLSFPMNVVYFFHNDTIKNSKGAVSMFEFINLEGRVYNATNIPAPEYVNQVEFSSQNGGYVLHFGMVCKEKGSFYIGLSPGGSFGKDHCDRSSLVNIFVNEERGLEQYIAYRHPQELTEYDLQRIYCFEVK